MDSEKAKDYILTHKKSVGDMAEEEMVVSDIDAETAIEIAESEMNEIANSQVKDSNEALSQAKQELDSVMSEVEELREFKKNVLRSSVDRAESKPVENVASIEELKRQFVTAYKKVRCLYPESLHESNKCETCSFNCGLKQFKSLMAIE